MTSRLNWLPDLKPDLITACQATGRWYHNWDHIEALMEDFHRLADHWQYPEAVETTILWHDVIYTAMSPTNEADSAVLMQDRLKGCVDPGVIGRFDRYDAAIRKELSAVPDNLCGSRRARVLDGFLQRDDLDLTAVFRQSHDRQARDNLRRAISRLSWAYPAPDHSPNRPEDGI